MSTDWDSTATTWLFRGLWWRSSRISYITLYFFPKIWLLFDQTFWQEWLYLLVDVFFSLLKCWEEIEICFKDKTFTLLNRWKRSSYSYLCFKIATICWKTCYKGRQFEISYFEVNKFNLSFFQEIRIMDVSNSIEKDRKREKEK